MGSDVITIERERIATALDAEAAKVDKGREYARTQGHREHEIVAKAEAKAYRHAASIVRKGAV